LVGRWWVVPAAQVASQRRQGSRLLAAGALGAAQRQGAPRDRGPLGRVGCRGASEGASVGSTDDRAWGSTRSVRRSTTGAQERRGAARPIASRARPQLWSRVVGLGVVASPGPRRGV